MREIMFRGKRLDGKGWAYGFYTKSPSGKTYITETTEIGGAHPILVDPETVGESTGFFDADNNMVYEGDIIDFGKQHKNGLYVWWNDEAFQWQAKAINAPYIKTFDIHSIRGEWTNIDFGWIASEIAVTGCITTRIIGNIYDNKDLFKTKKQEQPLSWEEF